MEKKKMNWKVFENELEHEGLHVIDDENGTIICEQISSIEYADLIAAVPTMFEQLKKLYKQALVISDLRHNNARG
jgi:hypothetical protein